jgi:hypothetical protein
MGGGGVSQKMAYNMTTVLERGYTIYLNKTLLKNMYIGCPINTCIALNFCAEQELLCIYISEQIKKKWNHSTIFRAQAVNFGARLFNKAIRLKLQRKICLQTIFALIWGMMVKLTYRLHQIATFWLLFPKTPIMSAFDAIMAIWLYGHMAIMATNSHIGIWPLWHLRWPLWVFSETPIQMWQFGEDGKSICPSCLKWGQKWSKGTFSFVFSAESLY